MFTMIDHMLEDATSLNKFKMIESIQDTFSEHNRIKLEINNDVTSGKITDII